MNLDARVVAEKSAIPGAEYHGVACGICGSRRTERIAGAKRRCAWCGNEGYIKVMPRGCFVEAAK